MGKVVLIGMADEEGKLRGKERGMVTVVYSSEEYLRYMSMYILTKT